jgi:hypothetical protein
MAEKLSLGKGEMIMRSNVVAIRTRKNCDEVSLSIEHAIIL